MFRGDSIGVSLLVCSLTVERRMFTPDNFEQTCSQVLKLICRITILF